MRTLWTRRAEEADQLVGSSGQDQSEQGKAPSGKTTSSTTEGKGRPTPKRRDAAGPRRGPLPPAPLTASEARARRKALAGPKLSRAERRSQASERRERQASSRARMMAGEEAYLLPRDKGPARAYTRDIVDSRRNLAGAFMPIALVMIGATVVAPQYQVLVTPAMLVLLLGMVADGLWLGRKVNNLVRLKYPDAPGSGFTLGWYAFTRATQLRRMRVPKPRVRAGDKI